MEQGILELIMTYIPIELTIVVAFVYCMGILLKKWEMLPDKFIPIVLWGVSILATILWYGVVDKNGITLTTTIESFVYGTFIVTIAVFGNQMWKQLMKK